VKEINAHSLVTVGNVDVETVNFSLFEKVSVIGITSLGSSRSRNETLLCFEVVLGELRKCPTLATFQPSERRKDVLGGKGYLRHPLLLKPRTP